MRLECARQTLAQVVQELPSISHLYGLRHSLPDGIGIGAGEVPADNLHTRVRGQLRYGLALRVGQKLDHPARLKGAQNGAVAMSLVPGPIVNAKNARSPQCKSASDLAKCGTMPHSIATISRSRLCG
jgi:hypothetical protein